VASIWVAMTVAALMAWHPASAEAPQTPVSGGPDFPRPTADPAAMARGRQVYGLNCGFCHGASARGGEKGPNLLRSAIVMNDQQGEVIGGFVSVGRPDKGMPRFDLSAQNVADIAAFLHSIDVGEQAATRFNPASVLVGNRTAGKVYFNGKGHCAACHFTSGDLAGIGSKYDPQHLQDAIFTAGGTGLFGEPSATASPTVVEVAMPSGERVKGQLVEIDEFFVVLIDERGSRRTIARRGDTPQVRVNNPLQAHLDMILSWEDRDIHDVTAYLATLK
jgi:cytochrome c oxidase cbb3-type subunit III